MEAEEKIGKLSSKVDWLNASKMSEENRVSNKHNDALNNLDGKLQTRIRDLTEDLSMRTSEHESNCRSYES